MPTTRPSTRTSLGAGTPVVMSWSTGQLVDGAQLVERALEHQELGRLEPIDELMLQVAQVHLERFVELVLTRAAQDDPLDSAIRGARLPLDETGGDEPVHEPGGPTAREAEL